MFLLACSDPPPASTPLPSPAPAAPAPETPAPAPAAPPAPVPAPVAPPASPPVLGELHVLSPDRWGDEEGPSAVLVEVPTAPRPEGPVVGYAQIHHAAWAFRELGVEPLPSAPIVVVDSYPASAVCETGVIRVRRLHAVVLSDDAPDEELGEATFLAYDLAGCPTGHLALVGARAAEVTAWQLDRAHLTEPAPIELVDLVREADGVYGTELPAAEFRMLALPQLDITVVAGELAHVVRDGRVWRERSGGDLGLLVEAAGHGFFEVSSPSEGWVSRLDCFAPTYGVGACEVTDPSGTPTNVRGGPSGRSAVLTTLSLGATVPADDRVGSWFHVRSTPPGWVHESAVRCTDLPPPPGSCP